MKEKVTIRFRHIVAMLIALVLVVVSSAAVSVYARERVSKEPTPNGGTKTYKDTDKKNLDDPGTTYIIQGQGSLKTDGNFFTVNSNKSSEGNPIVIILDNVNRSQEGKSPDSSFITIESGNYVIIKLRGNNYIKAGEDKQLLSVSNDGMAGIHVSSGSTVKVTSENGDGSTSGSLTVYGGGGKYGGAGIGTRYNDDTGTVIIAGGTINAYGGHCAAGIGSGRDGKATDIRITGGKIYAEGGQYAAGIGAGDNVGGGEGGDLVNITITGGDIEAVGGDDPDGTYEGGAGIGCSEGGSLHGTISISNATIKARGSAQAAGIGGGEGGKFHDGASIRIYSGNIDATGGSDGAGIGGGNGTGDDLKHTGYANVYIDQTKGSSLNITAHGGTNAAGIGAGDADGNLVSIHLEGGKIVSYGGENGSGIGAGDNVNTIDITGNGTIEAYGGRTAAGIGGGNDSTVKESLRIVGDTDGSTVTRGEVSSANARRLKITAIASYGTEPGNGYDNEGAAIGGAKATCGNITVENAILNTRADQQGADIGGGGFHLTPGGTVDTITINNCEITSSSKRKVAPGIGAGYGGSVNHINITNTKYTGGAIGGALIDWNYLGLNSVDSITIDNSDIKAEWDEDNPGHFQSQITPLAGPLDHGGAGIGSGQFGSMDSITITNSNIVAHGYGSGAGIGSGGGGGQNFSLLNFEKYDVGDVGTIEISNCHVEAKSGCASFKDMPPTIINDGYSDFEINPIDYGGGAGIGSGSVSNVEKINIHDCDYVYGYSYRGSGIGSGCATGLFKSGSVDHIYLENIDKIEAYGGEYCTGIGTGGGEGINGYAGDDLIEIYINNCKDITAKGGWGGAGIGLGYTSRYKSGSLKGERNITIIDSGIYAKGGKCGAGIGGGGEIANFTGYGGDSPQILISGKCRISAYGGNSELYEEDNGIHGGAAGIGGGNMGGASYIEIRLTEDETTPKGNYSEPYKSNYYVEAVGGDGAAGIGSGGNDWVNGGTFVKNSADSDTIIIKSGAVFAEGGDSVRAAAPKYADFSIGAGAGIGGASAEANVWSVSIYGGYIMAKAGSHVNENDKADDIGTGGDYSKVDDDFHRKSGHIYIGDGTVLTDNIGDFEKQAIVEGGSISAVVPHATKKDKSTYLYRTTIKTADSPYTKISVTPAKGSYNSDHIYTDSNQRAYLYLEELGDESNKDQSADITVNNEKRHYTGYTNTQHTGLMKMDGENCPFRDPGVIRQYEDFNLELDDATGWDNAEWTFTVEGSAIKKSSGNVTKSPGAKLSLYAEAYGTYVVNGTTPYTSDSEVYWGGKAEFKGNILKPLPDLSIVGTTWKYYDTKPADGPEVKTNSNGAVSYKWFTFEGEPLDSAPTEADYYQVAAVTAETNEFDTTETKPVYYTIYKARTKLAQYASEEDGGASIVIELLGFYDVNDLPEGTVAKVTVCDENEQEIPGLVDVAVPFAVENGKILAHFDRSQVAEGSYKVSVTCDLECKNYYHPDRSVEYYHKDLAYRNILADDVSVTYGDGTYNLTVSTNHPGTNDVYSYSIYSDTADELAERIGYPVEPTITLEPASNDYNNNSITVNVHHAGKARLVIKLVDEVNAYDNTFKVINFEVKPADLTVSSYAFEKGDADKKPVSNVKYGKVDTLDVDLMYTGLKNGDTPENFTHGYGTLKAVPMLKQLAASATPAEVGIQRIPVDATVDGQATKLFYARDYNVTYDTQSHAVKVDKARLALGALTTGVTYGENAPEFGWDISSNQQSYNCDGLVSWDLLDDALSEDPKVTFDPAATGGQNFPNIDVGSYANALKLSGGASDNYELVYVDGNLVINPADINDLMRMEFSVDDTFYNGAEQRQPVTITDNIFSTPYTLELNKDYTVDYNGTSLVYAGEVETFIRGIGNYEGTRYEYYSIKPRELTVVTESARKIYDGKPLTAGGELTGVLDTDSSKVSIEYTGSQTEVGRSDNTYSITFADENYEASYKVAEERLGSLYVATNDVSGCFVSAPGDVTYNGTEQRQAVTVTNMLREELTEGTDYSLTYSDNAIDAGTVKVTVSGKGAYTGTTFVTYNINPAPLKVDTDERIKEYDGTPLTAGGEIYGLVNSETATLKTTGSITDAGSVPNTYVIVWNGTAKEANYKVNAEDLGTLYVTPTDEGQNGINAEGYSGVYDGKVHLISAEALLEGSKMSFSTDGGTTWTTEAPVFKNAMDEPQYIMIKAENPDYVKGTATVGVQVNISRAPLTVETDSASKKYDGTPLTAAGKLTGLVNDETAELVMKGSQTEVGQSMNTYEIQWTGTAVASNYKVEEKLGTLTVTAAGGGSDKPDNPGGKPGAKTGDTGMPLLFLILTLIGLAGAGSIVILKKKLS